MDDWWRGHFSGLNLELWKAIVPPDKAREDADFLVRLCPPGARILDVPCGQGRVSIELAARGYAVTGIDIAPGLLAEARRRAPHLDWREGDMRDLPRGGYHLVCCWGDSFGYLDEQGNRDFLRAARAALEPGGKLALEMQLLAETLFPRFRTEASGEAGGIRVAVSRRFDARRGRLQAEYTLRRGAEIQQRSASYRIYTAAELCRMLEEAGFAAIELFDGKGGEFALGAEILRAVATAPAR
jgi:2-polyprenyl-3-methyl-5-hydroxy-6-metoxy-1,4-benzoquinol methylase